MIVVLVIVFVVDILLLSATGQFLGAQTHPGRVLLGSLAGTVFAGLSILPGFDFLHHTWWRLCRDRACTVHVDDHTPIT